MSTEAPVFRLTYGDIQLVIAEPTLSRNTAPFSIIAPSDDLDKVEDTALLAEFQSHFSILEEQVPKSIPMLRAYATLIMFYRISKNPNMNLSYEQAKDGLMGKNAEDTLLFIVAKLLRDDDVELRRYLQHPHILVSSLVKLKREFILGDGNVIQLFHKARETCEEKTLVRLTMKEFTSLYQQMNPATSSAGDAGSEKKDAAVEEEEEEKKEEEEKETEEEKEKEEEEEDEEEREEDEEEEKEEEKANVDAGRQTRARSAAAGSSTSSPPMYRSSSSRSSSKRRATTTADAKCVNCHRNNRPSKLMLCDHVDCETACHYDCCVPPLSAAPKGTWFCATCKPLVKRALEEEQSLIVQVQVQAANEEGKMADDEKKDASDSDQVEEMSVEQWQQKQAQWKRDKEQYEKELAMKNAEVQQLRAEVERYKRQRVEQKEQPMEEERKEGSGDEQGPAPAAQSSGPEEEQKEETPPKRVAKPKRRGRAL